METADPWTGDDLSKVWSLDRSAHRRVFVEGEMRASPVVIGGVAGHDPAQVLFSQRHDLIETLASQRPDNRST